jgi:hypothetical protein
VIVEWGKTNLQKLIEIIHIYYGEVAILYLLEGFGEAKQNKFEDMHQSFSDFAS